MRRQRGFTLLETLVALAIVGIALIAALRAIGSTALSVADLRERTLADWVAHDRLAQYRAEGSFPAPGRSEGRARQGKQAFLWRARISATPNAFFRRVEIDVLDPDGSHKLAGVTGFVTRPAR